MDVATDFSVNCLRATRKFQHPPDPDFGAATATARPALAKAQATGSTSPDQPTGMPELKLSRSMDEDAPWQGQCEGSLVESPLDPTVVKIRMEGDPGSPSSRTCSPAKRARHVERPGAAQPLAAACLSTAGGLTGMTQAELKQLRTIWNSQR